MSAINNSSDVSFYIAVTFPMLTCSKSRVLISYSEKIALEDQSKKDVKREGSSKLREIEN